MLQVYERATAVPRNGEKLVRGDARAKATPMLA